MDNRNYTYVLVGGGLAGASAIEGIREIDTRGSILLISGENNLPYDRPPLSKKLWFGKKKVEEIFLHDAAFYKDNSVDVALATIVTRINTGPRSVVTDRGETIGYSKLLLATGGTPRVLDIPGGTMDGICYYRTLDDYRLIRALASEGSSATIIGGGFIGSEIAAALAANGVKVTMIFPENYLVQRIFPENLGKAVQNHYTRRGIMVLSGDAPVSFEKKSGRITTKTSGGRAVESDMVIAGIGILPSISLAERAGLETGNGIIVDKYLATSNAAIYAAGDNANFIAAASGERARVEHWDNSISQGKTAGRNMAGAREAYDHIPYFFSDLFEFGYEAAGEIDSRLRTVSEWKKEFDTGIVYYLKEDRISGIMLCNIWDKIETAREIIRRRQVFTPGGIRELLAA